MPLPSNFQTGRVDGHWVDMAGAPAAGRVTFTPRASVLISRAESIAILPSVVMADLVNGSISVTLPATDDQDIVPVDWTWEVKTQIRGLKQQKFNIRVPQGTVVQLSLALSVESSPGTVALAGPRGLQGEQGIQGVTGATGPQGQIGPQGADSTVEGPQGIQGLTGPTGLQGTQGPAGADSTVAGPQGIQGPAGPTGPQGTQGATGPAGPQGTQGIQGPAGADGADADFTFTEAASDAAAQAADRAILYAKNAGGRSRLYTRDDVGVRSVAFLDDRPQLAFTSGAYYTLGGNESIHPSVSPDTVGAMTAHPVWLDAGSYDRETVTATVAAVSTWRLGVFADSGSLSPGARLLDAGALNMNSGTGARELSVTITIPTSGVYWLALLVDAYTARPTSCGWMGATGGTPSLPWVGHRGIMNPGGRGSWAARATGVATGAIPATFPGGHSWTDTTPQIALRRV